MYRSQETAFVFPGQGSQFVGMGVEFMTHPMTKDLFIEANDVLGFDLSGIMQSDEEQLKKTENTQPALMVVSVAALQYFLTQCDKEISECCAYVAGHSLGEYTALVAAKVLSFADALRLVRARGEAMAQAVPAGQGTMAAVIGLTLNDVDSVCRTVGCFLANDNAPNQHVISGETNKIDEASNILVMQDAKKVMRLDVTGPFHTKAMEPAAEKVASVMEDLEFSAPEVPLVMNVTAQPESNIAQIKENLVQQITQMVKWRESMVFLAEHEINTICEFGAGNVLAKLAKRNDDRLQGRAFQSPEDIDQALEALDAA